MSILDTILARKRQEVQALPPLPVTPEVLQHAMAARGGTRPFLAALQQPRHPNIGLIAEIKKASPSAGIIRPDFDPVAIARDYADAGADCLSILTDQHFFQGSITFLRSVREAVDLPLLRKDFIIDERQILEAVNAGADAILLIVAILTDQQLLHFHNLATLADLATLVEVHNLAELDRALAISPPLIGVNNRDLTSFQVDLGATEQVAQHLRRTGHLHGPQPILLVAESGIHTRNDVQRLQLCGARALLVGTSLMRPGQDLKTRVQDLLGTPAQTP